MLRIEKSTDGGIWLATFLATFLLFLLNVPYLFTYKPILAISRDPKLVTQNTDPMLTKKIRKLSAISRDPKIEQSTGIKHKKYCTNFLGNLQIQVEVNNKHDQSADL